MGLVLARPARKINLIVQVAGGARRTRAISSIRPAVSASEGQKKVGSLDGRRWRVSTGTPPWETDERVDARSGKNRPRVPEENNARRSQHSKQEDRQWDRITLP